MEQTCDEPGAGPVRVPLRDEVAGLRIYDGWILFGAIAGALTGGLLLGLVGYALSTGVMAIAGLGQFTASGNAVATFTAAGIGVAVGGLAGALLGVRRLPGAQHEIRG